MVYTDGDGLHFLLLHREAQEELENEGLKGEFDKKQASKSLATTLNKLIDKLENNVDDKGEGTEPLGSDEGVTTSTSEPTGKEPSDGRVKVRVTKIHRGSFEQKERKVREMSNENPQLRHIENVVKDLLEKEGLKAEGKIEIKILTTGDFSDEESFSEEDTKNLQDIIFNILVQGTEEVHKERKRQQQLEDNYRFVWNQNQEDSKNTRTGGDTDDVDF